MPFDIDGARKAGYSDTEIADHVGKQFGVDTATARKNGMDDATILANIKADPTYSMSNAELGLAGIGHGMRQLARSSLKLSPVAQLYEKFSGNELLPSNEQADAPLLNRTEGKIGSALGGALPFMGIPAGGLAKIPAAAIERFAPAAIAKVAPTIAKSTMVDSTLGGALQGASQPDGSMIDNIKHGAEGGALGGAIAKVLGKANQPFDNNLDPTRQAIADTALKQGFQLTPGALTNNKVLQSIEAAGSTLPFSGSKLKSIASNNQLTGNKIALGEMGEKTANAATPEVMGNTEARLSGVMNNMTNGKSIILDKNFISDLQAVKGQQEKLLDPSRDNKIQQLLDGWLTPLNKAESASIPADVYQANRSYYTKEAKANYQSNPQLASAYAGLRDALDNAAGRSLPPEDKAAWDLARKQWGNMKMIEKSIDPAGNIVPTKLAATLRTDRPKDFIYGRNDNPLTDVARFGTAFKPPIPSSGTSERLYGLSLLGALTGSVGGHLTTGDAMTGGLLGAAAPIATNAASGALVRAILGMPNVLSKGVVNESVLPPAVRQQLVRALAVTGAQSQLPAR